MFPDGIFRPALLQFPVIKYGPPPTFTPPPMPTPTPAMRDVLVLPVLAVAFVGFIILIIACAILGFLWMARRNKDKK